jgi:hypothetical protein
MTISHNSELMDVGVTLKDLSQSFLHNLEDAHNIDRSLNTSNRCPSAVSIVPLRSLTEVDQRVVKASLSIR